MDPLGYYYNKSCLSLCGKVNQGWIGEQHRNLRNKLREMNSIQFYYRPQRSCSKVMFSPLSVILFPGEGGCLADNTPRVATPPPGRQPPR